MTLEEAINSVYSGSLIHCTKQEYETEIRSGVQNQAAKWIDQGQGVRAIMALNEIKRLDEEHNYNKI